MKRLRPVHLLNLIRIMSEKEKKKKKERKKERKEKKSRTTMIHPLNTIIKTANVTNRYWVTIGYVDQ